MHNTRQQTNDLDHKISFMKKRTTSWIIKLGALLLSVILLSSCATTFNNSTGFGTPTKLKEYAKASSLWTVLGDNFNLPDESTNNPEVRREVEWFIRNPLYVTALAKRAKPFLFYIYQQVRKRNLPAELTLLPMIESAYNPFAINMGSGASGLWQMMTGTALGFGLHVNWWFDGRRDITTSTNAALNYMAYLGNFFNNNWILAIAAYNGGEGTVQDAVDLNAREGKQTDFWALPLPLQTKLYVPKLLALAIVIKNAKAYNIKLPFVPDAPYLAQVNVGSQIDLARAARLAGISLKELSLLNPGYNRWATSPQGPFTLLLPIKNVDHFERNLRHDPRNDRVTWYRFHVRKGDTLDSIAEHFHTSVSIIKQINHMHNNILSIGQELLIPSSQSKVTDIVIDHEKHYFKALHNIPEPHVVHYVVQRQDTLWSLAKKFHVTARAIRFWNGLKNNTITPGTTLEIWPPKPKPIYLYYTSWPYQVRAGDNLLEIAKRYHVPLNILKEQNHIKGNVIQIGEILRIPVAHYSLNHYPRFLYYVARDHIVHIKRPKTTSGFYKVEPGNDLYHIALLFHTSVSELKQLNGLRSNNLRVGQMLRVPEAKKPQAKRRHAISQHHNNWHPVSVSAHYKVRPGDNLYYIAHKYHTTVKQLKAINNLNSDALSVGQVLKLPGKQTVHLAVHHVNHPRPVTRPSKHYTVKVGDTLYGIARQFNVNYKQIMDWNNIHNVRDLHVGEQLVIH
jgi:membrane-bound lytic murein transglycosylase D